jgi:NTP pyrophosphatase (non-canonical NTP hydrolase)
LADIDAVDNHLGRAAAERSGWVRHDTEEPSMPDVGPHLIGARLRELQALQRQWAAYNFGDVGDGTHAFLGMIEELGEMAEAIGWAPGEDEDTVRAILLAIFVGKFAHHTLKRIQGIRVTEDHLEGARRALVNLDEATYYSELVERSVGLGSERDAAGVKDAFGDVVIYAMDIFNCMGADAQRALERTCEEVFVRDWKRYPKTGVPGEGAA